MKLASLKTKQKKMRTLAKLIDMIQWQPRREGRKQRGMERNRSSTLAPPCLWSLAEDLSRNAWERSLRQNFYKSLPLFFFFPSCLTQGHGKITWAILCHLPHIFPFEGRVKQRQTKVEYNVLLLHLYIMYVMCIWGDTI